MNPIYWIFAAVLFSSLNIYLFIRGAQALPKIKYVKIAYIVLFVSGPLSIFCGYTIDNTSKIQIVNLFRTISGYWIVFYPVLIIATFLADFSRLLNHLFKIYPLWIRLNYSLFKSIYLGIIVLFLLCISLYGFKTYTTPVIEELHLNFQKEDIPSVKLSVIAISDLHIGNISGEKRVSAWVNKINEQKPDIILIVGDIFDRNFNPRKSQSIVYELNRLNAKTGVFAVVGNHEYYSGINRAADNLKRSDIILLRDTSIITNKFVQIAGRDDLINANSKSLSEVYQYESGLISIVMDHQPNSIRRKEAVGLNSDLYISGHLHDGQIYPYNKIIKKRMGFISGYRKEGNTHFYISSGLGVSLVPIRLGTKSEIVKFNITISGPVKVSHDN